MKALISGSRKTKMLTYWLLDNLHEEHKFTEITVLEPEDEHPILEWAKSREIPINNNVFPPEVYNSSRLRDMKMIYTLSQFNPDIVITINRNHWLGEGAAERRKIKLIKYEDTYG